MGDGDKHDSGTAGGDAVNRSAGGWGDVGRAAEHLFSGESIEAEQFAEYTRRAAERERLDAEFDDAHLPESVIPELTHDGIVDPWGGPPADGLPDSAGAPEQPRRGPSPSLVAGVVVALAALAAVLIWGIGSGDEPGASTADVAGDDVTGPESETKPDATADGNQRWEAEPTDGWEPFDEFDEIIRERERDGVIAGDAMDATTIVLASVSSDGAARTEIEVGFIGAAQDVQAETDVSLEGGIGFVGSDGSYVDLLWYDDGSSKISESPTAWSSEVLWESPEKLIIVIEGVGVVQGEAVAVSVFLEVFGGINLQAFEIPIT